MKPLLAHTAVFVLAVYLVVCCSAMLESDPYGNLIAHSYSVWGDWSAHFTFISNLRERGLGWLSGDNPVFAGAPFQYPFLSHLITAALSAIFGVSTIHATEWISLTLMFFAPALVYRVYRQFGLAPLASFISVACFFLVGGYQWMSSQLKDTEPLTNQFDSASVFTQFVMFEFYPQRAFLFGLTILCTVGFFVLKQYQKGQLSQRTKVLSVLALSLLSLTHVHSFLALAAFLILFFGFHRSKSVFLYCLSIAVIGCSALAFLLLRHRHPEFQLSWDWVMPGWAMNSKPGLPAAQEMNPIWFWIFNTGLYLPMAGVGFYFAWLNKKAYPLAATWFGAGLFLFIIANIFNLQPYWYDNLKTFTYAFFFFAPFIGVFFEKLFFTKKVLFPVAALLFATQTYSGIHDLNFLRQKNQSATFFTAAEFSIAEDFKNVRQNPNDLVLFVPKHNHWVTCLAGSPVVMGFPGWLWSWGINYGVREQENNAILLGQPNAMELIKRLNVAYVVLHQSERVGQNPVNLDFFRSQFQKVLERDGWEIFSIKSRLASVR